MRIETWPSEVVPDWDERLERLRAIAEARAALDAEEAEVLAYVAMAGELAGDPRTAAVEVGGVLQVRRETASDRMERAVALVALPSVMAGLRAGRLTASHARAVVDAGCGHDDRLVEKVVGDLLARVAPDAVLLPSVLKQKVASRLAALDPSVGEEQHAGAGERVEVSKRADHDGLSTTRLRMTHLQTSEFWTVLDRLAQRLAEAGHEGSLAQRRVAALLGLCRGLWPDGLFQGADVPVYDVDLLLPLGLGTGPVTLNGETLTPEEALEVLAGARRVRAATTDPDDGGVVATSRPLSATGDRRVEAERPEDSPADGADDPAAAPPRVEPRVVALLGAALAAPVRLVPLDSAGYRLPEATRRYVRTRDVTCTGVACTRPADLTDADHRRPWPRGRTEPGNVDSRCRFDHLVKQSGGSVVRLPDGDVLWTTPDGRRTYRRPALHDERPQVTPAQVAAALRRLAARAGPGPGGGTEHRPSPAPPRLTPHHRPPAAYVLDDPLWAVHRAERLAPPPF